MDKTHTAESIADKLIAGGKVKASDRDLVIAIWEYIADGILDEIINHSTITITGTADLMTGEVTGTGTIS